MLKGPRRAVPTWSAWMPGVGVVGRKAEDVVVRNVVREGDQRGFEIFFVLEGEEAAAGEVGDGFGGFYFERAARGDEGHGGEAQWRSELADAVEDLLAVMAFVFQRRRLFC